jgi:endonuclease YncB( thermonuclease family)
MFGSRQKRSYLRLLLALCGCLALGAQAEIFSAKVIVVIDGDTLVVLREVGGDAAGSPSPFSSSRRHRGGQKLKVRLANIDAPEVGHAGMGGVPPNSQKDQPFGKQSRDSLLEMVGRKQVQIDSRAVDQYGRIVGLVLQGNRNINEEQVRRGFAWAAKGWGKGRRKAPKPHAAAQRAHAGEIYISLENDARQARRGLWAQDNPQAPWQWRKQHPPIRLFTKNRQNTYNETKPVMMTDAQCGQKTHCSQMVSCDEARFYFTQCGEQALDANQDGEPCESLCSSGE